MKVVTVSMTKLNAGHQVMVKALLDEPLAYTGKDLNYRSWLMKFLDKSPLPIVRGPGWWDHLTPEGARRLDMLTGPHGYVIARAFIQKTLGERQCTNSKTGK